MKRNDLQMMSGCWLSYDFCFEGVRHRNCVRLEEDYTPSVYLMYDDHDLEVTWVKRVRHRGKLIEVNITLCDDDDSPDFEHVVTSAWVNVYQSRGSRLSPLLLCDFEPTDWSYINYDSPFLSVSKSTFYITP